MARPVSTQPTERELIVLQTLWRQPNLSLREVYDEIKRKRPIAYPTTQRLLDIMYAKGYLKRDQSKWPTRYSPATSEDEAKRKLVAEVVKRWFGGSPQALIAYVQKGGRSGKKGKR